MYTVQELIEALQKCPRDYQIFLFAHGLPGLELGRVGINHESETVDLFAE